MLELNALKSKKLSELHEIAKSIGLKGVSGQKKIDLVYQIIDHQSANPPEANENIAVADTKEKSVNIPKSVPKINKNRPARSHHNDKKSTNSAEPPRIKDFRAMALAT